MQRRWKVLFGAAAAGAIVLGGNVGPAMAELEVHKVNEDLLKDGFPLPGHDPATDGTWFREDTNTGGTATLTTEYGAPAGFGAGAIKLTTDGTTTAKAQALTPHDVFNVPLLSVNHLSYYTYSDSDSDFAQADASYQLQIDTNGLSTTGGFTTLVYEPYLNPAGNPVLPDQWQFFNATNGNWWSTQPISCVGGLFTHPAGNGGAPPYTTPNAVATGCPGAVVVQIGVSIGSGAPNTIVAADGIRLISTTNDDTTTNFEPGPK